MRKPPRGVKKWARAKNRYCIALFKKGLTDSEIAPLMVKKFRSPCTTHAIRSKRGRLERKGKLKRGVAGSSKESKKKMPIKRPKRQKWTKKAEQRVAQLYKKGFEAKRIATCLKRERLRNEINSGAVSDRILTLKKHGLLEIETGRRVLAPTTKKPKVPIRNSVQITSEKGNFSFDNLSRDAFFDVLDICMKDKL